MKSVTDILGNTQLLLEIDFNPNLLFEEKLSLEHKSILSMLRVIEEFIKLPEKNPGSRGLLRDLIYQFIGSFFVSIFYRWLPIPVCDKDF